jgi:hypothetical protein
MIYVYCTNYAMVSLTLIVTNSSGSHKDLPDNIHIKL